MSSSLLKYHRNNIPHSGDANTRNITAFYSYGGSNGSSRRHSAYTDGYATAYAGANSSSYVFFVSNNENIYIETQQVSIVIPNADLPKYRKLYMYYIISQQLTPTNNSKVYYSDIGYKGVYKEKRNWYILSNIFWKSLYISFGDYCYFKENPLNINLSVCDTKNNIENFLNLFNDDYEDPYKICDWLINHEINVINRELYQNEQIVNDEKMLYERLQIVKRHFAINEDIVLKIYDYIVYDTKNKIMI